MNATSEKDSRGQVVMNYLRLLAANEDREWFKRNRALYDEAQAAFNSMVSQLISGIAEFEKGVAHLRAEDCTYRIYRDIRFSPDKSPYKRHMGAYINPKGKKSLHCGYYFMLMPGGNSLAAGGAWCLPSKILRAVRREIADNVDEFRDIVGQPQFRRYFKQIGEAHLKTLPAGFPRTFPYPELLRPKDYSVGRRLDDSLFDTSRWLPQTLRTFKAMKPMMDFLNFTIDDYI